MDSSECLNTILWSSMILLCVSSICMSGCIASRMLPDGIIYINNNDNNKYP